MLQQPLLQQINMIAIQVSVSVQTDCNNATGYICKIQWVFPAAMSCHTSQVFSCITSHVHETLTMCDKQTGGFSMSGLFCSHGTDRRTYARPLHTCYLLDAAKKEK